MSVAISVTGTKLIGGSSVSTINFTGITVASGDKALIASLSLGVTNAVSGVTATWDNGGTNQAMFSVGSKTAGVTPHIVYAQLFALRNPTVGAKTLTLSWTGANFPTVEAITVTGNDVTSDAAAFKNFNSNSITGSNAAISAAITSAIGDMVIGLYSAESFTSINNTLIYSDVTSSGADSAACRAAGAASVTVTGTPSASGSAAIIGFDIAAAAAAAPALILPRRLFLKR